MSIVYYAEKNNLKKIIELVDQGADVNEKDNEFTALIAASNYGHFEIVKYLVEHNADVNQQDKYESTALMFASRWKNCQIVKYLVKHGVDINKKDKYESTALIIASD